jgi:hypothetical protein
MQHYDLRVNMFGPEVCEGGTFICHAKQNSLIKKIAANHLMKEVQTDILLDPYICM